MSRRTVLYMILLHLFSIVSIHTGAHEGQNASFIYGVKRFVF